jgi:hypothetical protein
LTNIIYVWQQVEEDLHQWTKKSSERLPEEVERLLMKKVLHMNLLPMRLEKQDAKAVGAVVRDVKK